MKKFVFALLLVLAVWGVQYAARGYWEPDEPRFVLIAREMSVSGHRFLPLRNGEIYAHKPPLMMWLIQLGETLFPEPFGSRLPSLLGALLAVLAVQTLGQRHASATAGWIAAVIFATGWACAQTFGRGQIDGLLTGLELMAVNLLDLNRFRRPRKSAGRATVSLPASPHLTLVVPAFLLMGLGILAKGPVGLLIPLGSFLSFSYFLPVRHLPEGDRNRRFFVRTGLTGPVLLGGILLAVLLPVAWLCATMFENASAAYFNEIIFSQNLSRAGGAYGHLRPFYYLFLQFLVGFLPWTLFLPVAVRGWGQDKHLLKALTAWALFVVLFFTIPQSKRSVYILSAYAPAALCLGVAWDRLQASKFYRVVRAILLMTPPLLLLLAGLFFSVGCRYLPERWVEPGYLAPVHAWPFFLGAVLTLLPAVRCGRTACPLPRRAPGFLAGMVILQAVIGGLVYPAIGPLKEPRIMAALAQKYVPPAGRLQLYDMNGENLTLYARRLGTRRRSDADLLQGMREETRGLALFLERNGQDLESRFPGFIVETGVFPMGKKRYRWAAFQAPQVPR